MITPLHYFETIIVSRNGNPVLNQTPGSKEYIFGTKLWREKSNKKNKTMIIPIKDYLNEINLEYYRIAVEKLGDHFWDIVRIVTNDGVMLKKNGKEKKIFFNEKLNLKGRNVSELLFRGLDKYDRDMKTVNYQNLGLLDWVDFMKLLKGDFPPAQVKKNSAGKGKEVVSIISDIHRIRAVQEIALEEIMTHGKLRFSTRHKLNPVSKKILEKNPELDEFGILMWLVDRDDHEVMEFMN